MSEERSAAEKISKLALVSGTLLGLSGYSIFGNLAGLAGLGGAMFLLKNSIVRALTIKACLQSKSK
jgi:hypothetical protein